MLLLNVQIIWRSFVNFSQVEHKNFGQNFFNMSRIDQNNAETFYCFFTIAKRGELINNLEMKTL